MKALAVISSSSPVCSSSKKSLKRSEKMSATPKVKTNPPHREKRIALARVRISPLPPFAYCPAIASAIHSAPSMIPERNLILPMDGRAKKFICCLTPELSRTAARNGGVVHVTMQPSREAVSA